MSAEKKSANISGNLALDGSGKGLSIAGNADSLVAAKSGLKLDDDIVATTINLGNLDKKDVQNILDTLKPYENNMKFLTKKDLSAGVGLDSFGLGLKNTPEGLQKTNLSLDPSAVSFNGPSLNRDLPKLSLNKPSGDAGAKVTMPSLGLSSDVNADLGGSIKIPDISATAPQVKSLEVDKTPELKKGIYQPPKFKMPKFGLSGSREDLNGPDLKLENPKADFEAPSSKIKWPHSKWKSSKVKGPDEMLVPDVNVPTAKLNEDLSGPDVDIDLPKADFKGPEVDVKTPDLNIDPPSSKITWPHQKWKLRKFQGSMDSLDIDANDQLDIDLSVPKVEGGINAPVVDANIPKVDTYCPELEAAGADIDVEAPTGKINWPHLKWKKHKNHKGSLDIDGDLETPDVKLASPSIEGDLNVLPKAKLETPDAHLQAPDLDIDAPSGKINWPHMKWKKNKLHVPKPEVDASINAPVVDLSAPKIDGKINSPDLDLNGPKADVDVQIPKVDIDTPSGKIKMPTLKKPKWPTSKVNDVDLSAPKLDLSAPKLDGKINAPDLDLNGPKADVDVQIPKVDIDSPSGKIKMPTLKMPKWPTSKVNNVDLSAPKLDLSAPKIDGKINSPDLDLNGPKADVDVQIPKLDIDTPSGKIKMPTLKMPKWSTSKVNNVDVDLSAPKLDLSAPKLDGKINAPDLDLNGPKADVDVQIPKLDIDSPSGKIKMPTLKMPKWSTSNVNDVDVDLSAPKLDLSAPKIDGKINSPDLDLNGPKANVDVEIPKVDIDSAAKVNAGSPTGKFKWLTFKKKKHHPKDDFDADLNVPDIDLKKPELDLNTTGVNLSAPKPDISLDADLDANLSAPALNLKSPNIDSQISKPNVNVKAPTLDGPKLDVNAPDVNVGNPSGKFNWFGLRKNKTGTLKAPNVELESDLTVPDVSPKVPEVDFKSADFPLSAPKLCMGMDTPDLSMTAPYIKAPDVKLNNLIDADLKNPDLDMALPNVDAKIPKAVLTAPKVIQEAPSLGIQAPKIEGGLSNPDIDATKFKTDVNLSAPKTNLTLPDTKISTKDLKGPEVNINLPKGNAKVIIPDLQNADLNLSAPKVNKTLLAPNTDAELQGPAVATKPLKCDINPPKTDLKTADGQLKTPDLDLDLSDFKMPHYKVPGLDLSSPNAEISNVHTTGKAGIEVPKVDLGSPTADATISIPGVELNGPKLEPKVDLKAPDVDASVEKTNFPHMKLPNMSFPESKLKSGEVDDYANAADDDDDDDDDEDEADFPVFKVHSLPKPTVDGFDDISDALGFSKRQSGEKDYGISKGVKLPISNRVPKTTGKIDLYEILKSAKEKTPSAFQTDGKNNADLKLAAPNVYVGVSDGAKDLSLERGGTFKIEKPESVQGSADESQKLSLGLSNMLGLSSEDSDLV